MAVAAAALCLIGCTGRLLPLPDIADTISDKKFIVVTASTGDTWAGLAQTYLGDRGKAWYIAQYNNQIALDKNAKVVIPLVPMNQGGLTAKGYQTVPILVYSNISKNVTDNATVSLSSFAAHMEYIKENGYVTISFDQFRQFLDFKDQLPPKAVILTFDSGQRWVYEMAMPLLLQYQFRAALFVPTQAIGKPDALTWSELAQLAEAGFDIGTSGHTSHSLIANSDNAKTDVWLNALEQEISSAVKIVKSHLDMTCRYFAYPDGETNDMLISFLKQYGFTLGFTRKPGGNPFFADDYRLNRTVVDAKTDPEQFQRYLKTFQTADLQ
jgi:peptidoglycan/xylan/chitin deacetylase (PgdA/CDA1 family)